MGLKADNSSISSIEPLEPGAYPARIQSVIDLGMQPQQYNGEEKPPKQEIMLGYEFSDEFLQDENGEDNPEKPRVISERFALHSLNADRAKSTIRYKAIDPQLQYQGDFAQLVGRPVSLTIVQNKRRKDGKVFNNVAGISPMRAKEEAKCPPLVQDEVVFDQSDPSPEAWVQLHEWIQKIIKNGLNYSGSAVEKMLTSGQIDDPDPF